MNAVAIGFGMGFLVAAQVGPIWMLCARSVLRGGVRVGLAIGVGAAIIDTAYASLGVLGASTLLQISALRLALGLAGALLIALLGLRHLLVAIRVRSGLETPVEVQSPRAAFRTALVATAANPMTIGSWGAIFAAASTSHLAGFGFPAVPLLLTGVGAGSLCCFSCLSAAMAGLGTLLSTREHYVKLMDMLTSLGLIAFGGLIAWRAVQPQRP
jgi:threonine/homoserine/homoserine lactone efflux protein